MRVSDLVGHTTLPDTFPLPLDRPFTTAEALAEGVRYHHLRQLVDLGFLRRPLHGVYQSAALGDSTALRCAALRLVVPEDAVVCDRHAGWLHGAEMILAPGEHLDLRPISIFRPAGSGRLKRALADSGERNLLPRDIIEIDGVRATTPLRTTCDLGRVRFTDQAIAGMDMMLRHGGVRRPEVLAEVERFKGMRWVTTLRAIAPLIDARSESPPESVVRLRWIETGLPRPTPQHEVYDDVGGFLGRLDLGEPELRVAAEYDGAEWHSSPGQLARDRKRRGPIADRDWFIRVFRAPQVFTRTADVEGTLHEAFRDARRRFGRRIAS